MFSVVGSSCLHRQIKNISNLFVRTSYLKVKQLPCTLVNIKQIDIAYGGLSRGTSGIKEFYRQATGKKIKASNPEAIIKVTFDNLLNVPSAIVTYKDGSKLDLKPEGKTVNDIFEELRQKERQIFMEANKSTIDAYVQKQLKEFQEGVHYWSKKHQEMIKELKQNKDTQQNKKNQQNQKNV